MRMPWTPELQATLGIPKKSRKLTSSPRSRVWRVELDGRPAVLKQIVGGADARARYERELTALRAAARVAPGILGADPERLMVVLEHLEDEGPPEDWPVRYAQGLARLHATTGVADLPNWEPPSEADVDAFLAMAERLGELPSEGVRDELLALRERLGAGNRRDLLHGDPCSGNDLYTPYGLRFVDFEQASVGDGLVELAYLRIGFPTCWCVTDIDEPMLRAAEAAYFELRPELAGAELGDSCASWLIRGDALVERAHRGIADQLDRMVDQDWRWGPVSARERLDYRLGVVSELVGGELGPYCARIRGQLRARWPRLRPIPTKRQ